MKVYIDHISGDEVGSDAGSQEIEGGAIVTKASRRVAVGGDYGFESEEADDATETTLDVVDSHGLVAMQYSKAEYKALMKGFWKTLKAKLEAAVAEAEDDYTKNQAKEAYNKFAKEYALLKKFVKETVVKNFDEFEFYVGKSMNPDGLIIPARYEGAAASPTFYVFTAACRVEKY
ncbi:MAG: hypothetical protein MHM6MM_005796 [Cercozoa sp. M6MM]